MPFFSEINAFYLQYKCLLSIRMSKTVLAKTLGDEKKVGIKFGVSPNIRTFAPANGNRVAEAAAMQGNPVRIRDCACSCNPR